MNEADGSPGGGAVVADPAAPSAAPTAPESPALLTADAVANIVSATIEGRLKAFENGLFADARIELERVISTREGKYGLTESQARRLRATLSSVPRESLASEADAYLADMGLAKVSPVTPTAPQSPAPAAAAKPNISDRGSAAPIDTRDSEGVLHSRPLEMTRHDVDDLILKHGHDKGMQMFQERVLAALGRVRIKPPRG
jgi:hypothetical protein